MVCFRKIYHYFLINLFVLEGIFSRCTLGSLRNGFTRFIGKIFVYKHCFCYLNVHSVKQ